MVVAVGAQVVRRFAGGSPRFEQLAQVRQRHPQVPRAVARRQVGPEQVDGPLPAQRAVDDQQGQQGAHPRSSQCRRCCGHTAEGDLQGSEHGDLQRLSRCGW